MVRLLKEDSLDVGTVEEFMSRQQLSDWVNDKYTVWEIETPYGKYYYNSENAVLKVLEKVANNEEPVPYSISKCERIICGPSDYVRAEKNRKG